MPLTPFQVTVLRVIAANRSVGSHIAGGIGLNAAPDSPRFSAYVDIFHDVEEAVASASERDCASLAAAGYAITRQHWEPAYRRAWIERDGDGVKIEWTQDAAWRFFPVERDELLGWRLHAFDLLTNKALAMGARSETRDLVDIVSHCGAFPLHAVVWAACGKDPGWTPVTLLEQMRRNARIERVAMEEMRARIEPAELKARWLQIAEQAETRIVSAAQAGIEIGIAFLTPDGAVASHDSPGAISHCASLGGVVPRLAGVHYPVED